VLVGAKERHTIKTTRARVALARNLVRRWLVPVMV
jgi:hypothetical protein